MKAQLVTKECIENLPDGEYALFRNNTLLKTIYIEWVNREDNKGKGSRFDIDGEYPTYVNEFVKHYENDYIIPVSEVKLPIERVKNSFLN